MYKFLTTACASVFLVGCAGMNSEFEHNKPAKDSGYWLQQADEMSNDSLPQSIGENKVGVSGSAFVNVRDYKLINTGNLRLPVKVLEPFSTTTFSSSVSGVAPNDDAVSFGGNHYAYDTTCSARYCYPEPANPLRESDRISRMWLAPYVSPDNNVHLGEIVYFITKSSQWSGVEESKK